MRIIGMGQASVYKPHMRVDPQGQGLSFKGLGLREQ